jgi:predicted lipoprotein with Yx(FWY)xxD motif
MRAPLKFLLPILGASLLLAACGSSSSTSSSGTAATPSAPAATKSAASGSAVLVKTASNSKLGTTVLVDAQGMTLYHLSVEQHGKFICTSAACVNVWHPLTVASGSKPSGTVGSLGAIKRPGGGLQVTYKGQPLYTFAQDTSAGQANGQGVKDVGTWTAATTSAGTSSAAATPTTPASSSGGGYAY